jgi:hypothetical protein
MNSINFVMRYVTRSLTNTINSDQVGRLIEKIERLQHRGNQSNFLHYLLRLGTRIYDINLKSRMEV